MDKAMTNLKWNGNVEHQVERCIEALETKGHLRAINFVVDANGPKYKVTITRMVTIEMDLEDLTDGQGDRSPAAGD